MGYHKFDALEEKMCKELQALEEKYRANPGDMSAQDLEKIDKLYHALKSKATYDAMKMADMDDYEEDGMSGRRGRGGNGRYMSMDSGWPDRGMSYGYPPMYPPRYPR